MPDAIRTHDLQSRSLTLYPTELRARISWRPIYYNRKAGKSKERKEEDFSERERASGGRKVLKKGKEKNFEKMLFFSKKVLTKREGRGIINELSPRQAPESLGE